MSHTSKKNGVVASSEGGIAGKRQEAKRGQVVPGNLERVDQGVGVEGREGEPVKRRRWPLYGVVLSGRVCRTFTTSNTLDNDAEGEFQFQKERGRSSEGKQEEG